MIPKIKKTLISLLAIVVVLCTTTGCEEEDYEVAAKSLRSLTSFTMTEVFAKNPTLIGPVCQVAKLNKEAIVTREVDPVKAQAAIDTVIAEMRNLDEEDIQRVKQLLSVMLPMLDMPDEPVLKEPYISFLLAFYDGILDSCRIEQDLITSIPASYAI